MDFINIFSTTKMAFITKNHGNNKIPLKMFWNAENRTRCYWIRRHECQPLNFGSLISMVCFKESDEPINGDDNRKVQPVLKSVEPVTLATSYATYVRLSCEVEDPHSEFSVIWFKNGDPVDLSIPR